MDELLDMESDDTRAARVKVRERLEGSRVRSGELGVEVCLEALPLGEARHRSPAFFGLSQPAL